MWSRLSGFAMLTSFVVSSVATPLGSGTSNSQSERLMSRDVEVSGTQQIALASYIYPSGANSATWNRLINYPTDKISVLVANVNSGPTSTVDTSWQDVITRADATGKTVLGYVRTGYLGLSVDHFTTPAGSSAVADWITQIESDIDLWYQLYPGLIGGIFFDEGYNVCGTNNQYSDVYHQLSEYAKSKASSAFTVINPGSPTQQCYENSADTLLTFEGSYTTYINSYVPNDWTPSDIRKIWHIVYSTPAADVMQTAQLALQRGAGLIHLTDEGPNPNPYDTLPDDAYMQSEINAVAGGTPLIGS